MEWYEIHKYFCGGTVGNLNTLVEKIFHPFHRKEFEEKPEHHILRTPEKHGQRGIRL